jgi:hypothetical protein
MSLKAVRGSSFICYQGNLSRLFRSKSFSFHSMIVVRPFLTVPFHVIPGFLAFFGDSQLVDVIDQVIRPITTSYALRLCFRCSQILPYYGPCLSAC